MRTRLVGDALPGLVGGPSPAPVSVPPADAQAPGVASPPPIQIDLVAALQWWYEDDGEVDGIAWGQTYQEFLEGLEEAAQRSHQAQTMQAALMSMDPQSQAYQNAIQAQFQTQQAHLQQQLGGIQNPQGALIGGIGGAIFGSILGGLLGGAIKKPGNQ